MPSPPSSNRKLALFLATVVLAPVVLVLGPFRDRFFPKQARAVAAIAELPRTRFTPSDLAELLTPAQIATLGERFTEAAAARDWNGVALALERVEASQATAHVRYLHGLANLHAGHPARALAGLKDAVALTVTPNAATAALHDDTRLALAQALLQLIRADEARRELTLLDRPSCRHAEQAHAQLLRLAALQ